MAEHIIPKSPIQSAAIAENAVQRDHIAPGAVGNAELGSDVVTQSKIAPEAVGSSEIQAGAVGVSELATAVTDLIGSKAAAALQPRVLDSTGAVVPTKAADIILDANGEVDNIIIRTVS
jgi:NADH/NAD ratio-sensing transcriptional regulator Rex